MEFKVAKIIQSVLQLLLVAAIVGITSHFAVKGVTVIELLMVGLLGLPFLIIVWRLLDLVGQEGILELALQGYLVISCLAAGLWVASRSLEVAVGIVLGLLLWFSAKDLISKI